MSKSNSNKRLASDSKVPTITDSKRDIPDIVSIATIPKLLKRAISLYLLKVETTEEIATRVLLETIEEGVLKNPTALTGLDPIWAKLLALTSKRQLTLGDAMVWYAQTLGVSLPNGVQVFLESVERAATTDPKFLDNLGTVWKEKIQGVMLARESSKQRVRRHREGRRLEAIDLTKLDRANIKSGFRDVYENANGWRARVKLAEGGWKFLATRQLPEQAAFDRIEWYEKNAPWELLPARLREYYDQYKVQNPEASHDEALAWAKETDAFSFGAVE